MSDEEFARNLQNLFDEEYKTHCLQMKNEQSLTPVGTYNRKRKISETEFSDDADDLAQSTSSNLPKCPYGNSCYRKNPKHFQEFLHESICTADNNLLTKWEKTKPFNFFLTSVTGIDKKFNDVSVDIREILSDAFGELVKSAQFNFKIDIPWLVDCYPAKFRSKPVLIVHGCKGSEKFDLEGEAMKFKHINLCQARLDIPYGTHHTKMMLLEYVDGLRIVIHTANLVEGDWYQKTQGVWISPHFNKLKDKNVDCLNNFKKDLIDYLNGYKAVKLKEWIDIIKSHDLSSCKVQLVASIPGRHVNKEKHMWGHLKLQSILKNVDITKNDWQIVGQFSSIGSLGDKKENWLTSEFQSSLNTNKNILSSSSKMLLMFPTVENVRTSLEGYPAGGSLPYSSSTAKKQQYLTSFLHVWKADKNGRSKASPHIKTYTKVSADCTKLAWFLCTSANLSKAAWGVLEKKESQLMIRSYELGILFLPKNFYKEFFSTNEFNVPYDLPLKKYEKLDMPWLWDVQYIEKPDSHGMKWCPS